MEPKEFDIEFTRGDTCPVSFELQDEDKKEIKLKETDEMYFTVKKNFNTNDIIFQKKYSNKEITEEKEGYSLTIMPIDTNRLNYGNYVYDLCIKSGDLVRTLCLGQLVLTNEVTFSSNE